MNTTPSAGPSHPLAAAYLNDLERALSTADQQERIDTIAAVREHLADALGGDAEPTTERVRGVLEELGSVEQIAASATPASPASAVPVSETGRGGWTAPVLLATAIVSLVIPFFGALLAIGCLVAAIVLLRGDAQRRGMLQATIAVSIATLLVTAVLAAGTLAWSGFADSGSSVSSAPVVAPTTGP